MGDGTILGCEKQNLKKSRYVPLTSMYLLPRCMDKSACTAQRPYSYVGVEEYIGWDVHGRKNFFAYNIAGFRIAYFIIYTSADSDHSSTGTGKVLVSRLIYLKNNWKIYHRACFTLLRNLPMPIRSNF